MSFLSKIPKQISVLKRISFGATSVVYQLNADIVVKYRYGEAEQFKREQEILRLLTGLPSYCSAIVQCFYCHEDLIFLEYLPGTTLDERYYYRREKDQYEGVPVPVISQWIYDLAGAVATLEEIGFVHGDLAPHNIMVSPRNQVTLIDFDCAQRIGDLYDGVGAPYHRILDTDETSLGRPGSFGIAGPRTEQFFLG